MKRVLTYLAVIAFVSFSCTAIKEDIDVNNEAEEVNSETENESFVDYTFKVSIREAETKVSFGEPYDDGGSKKIPMYWADGDKITFQYLKDETLKTIDGTVSVDGSGARITVSIPTGGVIQDAWYPAQGTKHTSVLRDQRYGRVAVPLEAVDASAAVGEMVFQPISTIAYSVVAYHLSGTDKILKNLKLTIDKPGGGTIVYQIKFDSSGSSASGINESINGGKDFYIVIPADGNPTTAVFNTEITLSNNMVYNRNLSSVALADGKFLKVPDIDLDKTPGRYFWDFRGTDPVTTSEDHFKYWFKQTGTSMEGISYGVNGITVTMNDSSNGSMNNFEGKLCPAWPQNNDNGDIYYGYYGDDKPSVTHATGSFFEVNAGNYPVFAVKTNVRSIAANSMETILDLNSSAKNNPVRYTSNNLAFSVGEDELAGVLYFNLLTQNIKLGSTAGKAPTTRSMYLTGWALKFQNFKFGDRQDSAPTYLVEWAGFFNSVDELKTYVQNGVFYAD